MCPRANTIIKFTPTRFRLAYVEQMHVNIMNLFVVISDALGLFLYNFAAIKVFLFNLFSYKLSQQFPWNVYLFLRVCPILLGSINTSSVCVCVYVCASQEWTCNLDEDFDENKFWRDQDRVFVTVVWWKFSVDISLFWFCILFGEILRWFIEEQTFFDKQRFWVLVGKA